MADKQRDSTARRLVFRIRIHAGEVIVRDGDLFGEGVNIAARLESLADPGGTVVSAGVYREVRGKLARRSKTEAGIG